MAGKGNNGGTETFRRILYCKHVCVVCCPPIYSVRQSTHTFRVLMRSHLRQGSIGQGVVWSHRIRDTGSYIREGRQ